MSRPEPWASPSRGLQSLILERGPHLRTWGFMFSGFIMEPSLAQAKNHPYFNILSKLCFFNNVFVSFTSKFVGEDSWESFGQKIKPGSPKGNQS